MNFRQILLILRLRWWLVLLLFLITVGGTLMVVMNMSKKYTSTTSILLDIKTDPLLATLAPNLATPGFIATQTEIIKSDRLGTRVVKMLGLAENPAVVAQWREQTQGRVPLETYFGELMQNGLQVEPGRGSTIVNVTYTASDPKFAAAVANTFARAYIDLSVELRLGPTREYAGFFDDRMKQLKADLEAAQAKLSAFQQRKGIVASVERLDLEMSRLTQLETALASAIAESADTSSRTRNSGGESSVDVQQSAVVQGLKGELARAETKLNEISTNYGSNHPVRIQLEAQITELKQQIASEMRRVSGATANINRMAGQKIGELRSLIDTQKRTVLSLRVERDEASVLQREVDTAQRAYEAVATRRSQLANESQAEQAAARILSPATEPLTHSSPNIKKAMVAAVILGLLLGVGAAVAWEMIDRRIRSEADMAIIEGVPVLGVMSARTSKSGYMRRLAPSQLPNLPPQLTLEAGPR
jgi:chain length determinant protein EpsF